MAFTKTTRKESKAMWSEVKTAYNDNNGDFYIVGTDNGKEEVLVVVDTGTKEIEFLKTDAQENETVQTLLSESLADLPLAIFKAEFYDGDFER